MMPAFLLLDAMITMNLKKSRKRPGSPLYEMGYGLPILRLNRCFASDKEQKEFQSKLLDVLTQRYRRIACRFILDKKMKPEAN